MIISLKSNKIKSYLHCKARLSAGFTLIELLIVIAIIGILSAVGIPAYNGYINSTKESAAKNDLQAIALMQADYFSDNNSYCLTSCNSSTKINTTLFNKNTLDTSGDYDYKVVYHDSGFEAVASPKSGKSLTKYCLTQNNDLNSDSSCP